jgi:IS30 family transposase
MPRAPLSLPEREEISRALIAEPDLSWAKTARVVVRDPTTIAREVRRHGDRAGYRPAAADPAAGVSRGRPQCRRLETPGPLRDRVTTELRAGRSPVAIWADLVAEDTERVCVETIYAALSPGSSTRSPRSACGRVGPGAGPARPATPTCPL